MFESLEHLLKSCFDDDAHSNTNKRYEMLTHTNCCLVSNLLMCFGGLYSKQYGPIFTDNVPNLFLQSQEMYHFLCYNHITGCTKL